MVRIYNGILLSHEKECTWISSDEYMNLEPIIEWSKSEREKPIYTNILIYRESRKVVLMNLLQDSSGDADKENRLVNMGQEGGESGMNGESSMESYTLPYVK